MEDNIIVIRDPKTFYFKFDFLMNHINVFKLSQRLHLRIWNKQATLRNLFIYYIWKNIRKQYKNNKLKIIAPTWNDEFELPDGSYSVSEYYSI